MSFYKITELENKILSVSFYSGLPTGSKGGNASPHFELKALLQKASYDGIICDISKSDYKYGDYISAVWIVGVSAKKKTCIIAREEQKSSVKELMKLTFEVPIFQNLESAMSFLLG